MSTIWKRHIGDFPLLQSVDILSAQDLCEGWRNKSTLTRNNFANLHSQREFPQRENASAYIVQDRDNQEEMTRLEIQDKMLTNGQGGPLPELTDPTRLRRVLDIGCGTGDWLMEAARTYPMIEKLCGGDISSKMLSYARAKAEAAHLDKRVQFYGMDALRVLEFPDSYFDLINQRLGASWLRTWEWKKLLIEYQRVCRPGGIVRITEMNGLIESTSPALTLLGDISLRAFYHSGRLFEEGGDGVTGHLVRLMTQHAFKNIQTRIHTIVLQTGTEMGQHFYDSVAIGYRVAIPFFQKWTRVPSDYQEIYQQALKEMQQPDFVATWTLLTVWATTPVDGQPMLMRGLR
jgi:ubiquinone/menaquinone biosynthesis C-methylase UbiE